MAAVVAASLVQLPSAQRGSTVPSVSVRPPDFIYKVTAGAALPSLGWKIGVPIGAFVLADQGKGFEATPAPPEAADDAGENEE